MPKVDLESVPANNATGYPDPFHREVQGRWWKRIAPLGGLTEMGASDVTLEPGAWSSQRHWHDGEDELVVMLSGRAVLVEDDGETGYFYACDSSHENFILDAMHIYNVKHVIDKGQIYLLSVIWSSDGLKAGLFINRQPHALIDFSAHRGYCRSNFPPPAPEWAKFHPDHAWDMKVLDLLV